MHLKKRILICIFKILLNCNLNKCILKMPYKMHLFKLQFKSISNEGKIDFNLKKN